MSVLEISLWMYVSRNVGSHRRPSRKCSGTRLSTTGDGDKIVAHRAVPLEFGLVWLTHCLEHFQLAANIYRLGFQITPGFPMCPEYIHIFHFGSEYKLLHLSQSMIMRAYPGSHNCLLSYTWSASHSFLLGGCRQCSIMTKSMGSATSLTVLKSLPFNLPAMWPCLVILSFCAIDFLSTKWA